MKYTKCILLLTVIFMGTSGGFGSDSDEIDLIIDEMDNKQEKFDLTKAKEILDGKHQVLPKERWAAVELFLKNPNEKIALYAISLKNGYWLDYFEKKEKFNAFDVKLMIHGLVKMALPDAPEPGGEEQSAQRGAVSRLASRLRKALTQHGADTSDLKLTDTTQTQVRKWLAEVIVVSLKQQGLDPGLRESLQSIKMEIY